MMQDLFVHDAAHAHDKPLDIRSRFAALRQCYVEMLFYLRVCRLRLARLRLSLTIKSDTLEFIQGIALMVSLAGLMFFMLLL